MARLGHRSFGSQQVDAATAERDTPGQRVQQVASELPVSAGDEDAHAGDRPQPADPQPASTTGARDSRGSHQARLSAYQATVAANPSSHEIVGSQFSWRTDLAGIEQIAAVVSGTVGHDLLQRRGLAQGGQDQVGDLHDGCLDATPHVVRLANLAPTEDRLDGRAVIANVQPFAPVLRGGVQGQVLVVEGRRGEDRYDLLGELKGTVIVGAIRDGDRATRRSRRRRARRGPPRPCWRCRACGDDTGSPR